jgi:hypothetical protein
MLTGYPMTDTPVNMLGLNNSGGMEFMNLDPLFQNVRPLGHAFDCSNPPQLTPQTLPGGGGGITPEEGLPINFNISPFIESPQPTDDAAESGNLPLQQQQQQQQQHPPPPPQIPPHMQPQIPFHPQFRNPYGIPIPTTHRMKLDRIRRNSAPELSIHEQERQNKHASRRASHNIVEKRYRINLNSKFRKLDEIVLCGTDPSFIPDPAHGSSNSANSNSEGAASAPVSAMAAQANRSQPPKASIIDSALNYIENLQREVHDLKQRLQLYEKGGVTLQVQTGGNTLPDLGAATGAGDVQDFADEHANDACESSSVKSESPFEQWTPV